MPRVYLNREQAACTGVGEIEVSARTYRQAVAEIKHRFPQLPQASFESCMVVIDGVLIRNPYLEEIGADSELRFISKLAAG